MLHRYNSRSLMTIVDAGTASNLEEISRHHPVLCASCIAVGRQRTLDHYFVFAPVQTTGSPSVHSAWWLM